MGASVPAWTVRRAKLRGRRPAGRRDKQTGLREAFGTQVD